MLYNKSAHELHEMLIKKQVTSREITESVIERTLAVEKNIKAYITLIPEIALETASTVDKKIAAGEQIRPLEGIPTAIKDNICTKGVATTCASKMLENFIPTYDAFVMKRVNECNIPVLGKLNMDEFAMGSSTESSYFKKTCNPHDTERVPGGSSGGSAAAVAAGEAVFTLGSDTGGSIRQPAAFCGIVGLKPSYGLVSRFGLIAYASSLDQIGTLTKDVTDCANALNLIAGHDCMDSTSLNIQIPDYTKSLVNDVCGFRIGVPAEYMGEGISADVRAAIERAIEVYKSLGAVVEEFSMPLAKYALPAYYIIASAEASSNLARYDGIKYGHSACEGNYSGLAELYKNTRSEGFGEEVQRRILLGTYALSSGYYDAYYKKAQKACAVIRSTFSEAFGKYDVILTPTAPNTAWKFGGKSKSPTEMYLEDICTVSVNIAGLPAMSVPCGTDSSGLPIGMQLIGNMLCEQTLIRAAYAYEVADV
jgi:aspartyl-tRNA(Asn)/glutamyl-tRNA(Gln) amidotransferase subunit A